MPSDTCGEREGFDGRKEVFHGGREGLPKKDFAHDPFVRILCDAQHLDNERRGAVRCDAHCAAERTLRNRHCSHADVDGRAQIPML